MKRKRMEEPEDDEGIEIEFEDEPMPAPRGKPRVLEVEIVQADDDLVVVNKPAGLAMLPIGDEDSLLERLCMMLDVDADRLRLLDRLDAGASGVMVVARNAGAEVNLAHQFGQQTFERRYLAIVRGAPAETSGVIDMEIGPDRKRSDRMRIGGPHARQAITEWTLRDRYAGFALLECRPRTERTHQVRLHLQAMGMPLAVDPEYGGSSELMLSSFKTDYKSSRRHEERPLMGRLSLHSASIAFVHPTSGAACKFEAGLPKDFRATVNQLEKYGRIGRGE